MIQVSLALDRLLDTVADVAKDMRDEGTKAIQETSLMLVGGSFFIAFLNLFMTRKQSHRDQDAELSTDSEPAQLGSPVSLPLPHEHRNPALGPE
jgi:hypothetical protein